MPNIIKWHRDTSRIKQLTRYDLIIDYNANYVKDEFLKTNFLDFHRDKDLIVVRTGFDLVRHLSVIKAHHTKINQLGYAVNEFNSENLFLKWYSDLFKLNSNLRVKFNQMINMSSEGKLICAQIRLGGDGDFITFASRDSTKAYWKFIKDNLIPKNENYKLFITSDKDYVLDEASNEFGANQVIAFKDRSYHIARLKIENNPNKDKECDKRSELFLEFLFLGKCDKAVISHSGFGMYGILTGKNEQQLNQSFFIYSNPTDIRNGFTNRNNLKFMPFTVAILYTEFPYLL